MALDLSALVTPVVQNTSPIVLAVLCVFAGLMVVVVAVSAAYMVLGAVQGKRMIGGKMWDKDVYEAALQDIYSQKRGGKLLDAASNEALRDYQGFSGRRRGL